LPKRGNKAEERVLESLNQELGIVSCLTKTPVLS